MGVFFVRTLRFLSAAAAALALAGAAATAAADPVTNSNWAAVNDNAGLGGSFVFINSGSSNPLDYASGWTTDWSPDDVVFDAYFGETQYTNYDSWDESSYIFSFGAPDTSTYGETFFAPGGNLTSFNFLIYNYSSGGGGGGGCDDECPASLGPVDATFVVAAWNGFGVSGPALYSQSVVVPQTGGFAWTNIGGFNLALNQGQQYVAFLTVAGIDSNGGIPEPGTWALMILGFGGAGAALRRRRTALA
jgi:hypothetical protein